MHQLASRSIWPLRVFSDLPAVGQMEETPETFSGKVTGYLDGSGVLTIRSSKGTNCKGTFVYVDGREGAGTFECDDGRSGPFQFVSAGDHGTGHGSLAGKRFVFTFG